MDLSLEVDDTTATKTCAFSFFISSRRRHTGWPRDWSSDVCSSDLITCDSAEPRSVQDLKRNGIKALPAKKGPGSIEHGIKWLQGHKIIVDESCTETIKELSTRSEERRVGKESGSRQRECHTRTRNR